MTPPPDMPDLPPRPVPRAPLTDVVPWRTLVIIAVVVVLAVIGAVLALTLGGGGSKGTKSSGAAKATVAASESAGTKEDASGGTRADASPSESAVAGSGSGSTEVTASGGSGAGSGGSSGGVGAVSSTHKGSQGYSIGLPKGWKYQSAGAAGDRFTGPHGQKLLIAWTSTPKSDPVADWKSQERYMVRSQYRRIRIEKVDSRDWNAADWEFTYVEGGTKYRTIDRGFVVNGHLGYALMYTAKAADWGSELRKATWRTLARTFEPAS